MFPYGLLDEERAADHEDPHAGIMDPRATHLSWAIGTDMTQDIAGHRSATRMVRTGLLAAAVALSLAVLPGAAPRRTAQSGSPAEIAAKLTGRWKLNADLTPAPAPSGRGRGRASLALALALVQRGRRGGGGGGQLGEGSAPLTAEEVAAQEALGILHQVPLEITIEATADTVTFREPRGERRYTIDGKSSVMYVPGGRLHSKTKWDHATLRQEFSSAHKKLVKSWSIDANDRLVLTEKFESFASNSESKAVFDREPAASPGAAAEPGRPKSLRN
jgi:hypothetical protein